MSRRKEAPAKDLAASYNSFKTFHGRQYTGMKVGRAIKWHYDKGVWKDKKISPDKWEISFEVQKHRAGHAPEGSGAPVGTEYHWYIMAHQVVKKLDANTYSTDMNGVKFKVSHKRSNKEHWSLNDKAQRKQLIKILKAYIEELELEPAGPPGEELAEIKAAPAKKAAPKKKAVKRKKAVRERELA